MFPYPTIIIFVECAPLKPSSNNKSRSPKALKQHPSYPMVIIYSGSAPTPTPLPQSLQTTHVRIPLLLPNSHDLCRIGCPTALEQGVLECDIFAAERAHDSSAASRSNRTATEAEAHAAKEGRLSSSNEP
jgi:hypothetical protein